MSILAICNEATELVPCVHVYTCTFFLPPFLSPSLTVHSPEHEGIALPTTRHRTYIDPTTYASANVAVHEYTTEIPPKHLKLQEEIGACKTLFINITHLASTCYPSNTTVEERYIPYSGKRYTEIQAVLVYSI